MRLAQPVLDKEAGNQFSGGLAYEPWLISPQTRPGFQTFSIKNRTFNPAVGTSTTLTFSMGASGSWQATFYDGQGAPVQTFTGSGNSGTAIWGGSSQVDGQYSYKLEFTSQQGEVAAPATGFVFIDSNKTLTISNLTAAPDAFSPNNDDVQDTTGITADLSFDDASWTLNIYSGADPQPGQAPVRTATGQGTPVSFDWNGKSDSGTPQNDGQYSCVLSATAGTLSASAAVTVLLDKTKPGADILTPTSNQVISNVYQNGSTDVNITGSAADTNLEAWTLEYGVGATPASWNFVATGTLPAVSYTLDTDPFAQPPMPNGTYTLRLTVNDLAGNLAQKTRKFQVAHFYMTRNVEQFNGYAGGVVTFTSIVPFLLKQSITITIHQATRFGRCCRASRGRREPILTPGMGVITRTLFCLMGVITTRAMSRREVMKCRGMIFGTSRRPVSTSTTSPSLRLSILLVITR